MSNQIYIGVLDQDNLMDYHCFGSITKNNPGVFFHYHYHWVERTWSEAYEGELQLLESAHLVGLYLDSDPQIVGR